MTKRRSSKSTGNLERAAVTGLSGLVIILIVLIAQLVGVDGLPTENEEADNQPVVEDSGDTGDIPPGSLVPIPGGYNGGWFQLYFTDPIDSHDEADFQGSPLEAALVAALDGSTQSIDAALYELNSQPITDALIRAKEQRNVQVRVVTDGEAGLESPDTTVDQLELADIPLMSDGTRGAEMHDKFIVIDQTYVWTGSTNLTHTGIYTQNNNAILIRSSRLAQNYTTEFEELFNGEFGKSSPTNVPNPDLIVDGTRIETFFESEGNAPARLAELLSQAQSVRFMAFSFTDSLSWTDSSGEHAIMDLLIDRATAGQLDLLGVVEATSRRFVEPMVCAGLNVREDTNPDFMHHKVMIIDGAIVVTGSFNFSGSAANDNDENLLIIHNGDIARAYLEEFNRVWGDWSEPIPGSTFGC